MYVDSHSPCSLSWAADVVASSNTPDTNPGSLVSQLHARKMSSGAQWPTSTERQLTGPLHALLRAQEVYER